MTRSEVLRIIDSMRAAVRLLEGVSEKLKEDPDLRREIMSEKLKKELVDEYLERSFW